MAESSLAIGACQELVLSLKNNVSVSMNFVYPYVQAKSNSLFLV